VRHLVANFDCEISWARASTPGPHRDLPRALATAVSQASLVMAALGRPGDVLWTIADVGATECELEVRAPAAAAPHDALYWGQVVPSPLLDTPPRGPWRDRLWQLRCAPAIAAAVNDRRFCRELATDLDGLTTRVVRGLEELDEALSTMALGPDDAWVCKAIFSAAGRERIVRRGRVLEGEMRTRAERLLARYGAMIVEPWHSRVEDFGTAGLVAADSVELFPTHRLLCDPQGGFRGVEIGPLEVPTEIPAAAQRAGQALRAQGYRGPFAVDSYTYEEGGRRSCRSLCEINARMSLGLIARARFEETGEREFALPSVFS
jgi:hypothetical protein